MNSEAIYLSKSEFARSQGWSPSYVTKLKDQQKLVLSEDGKLVDVSATLALLKRTEDPAKESVRIHHAAGRSRNPTSNDKPPRGSKESDAADPKYWENKARREGALAALAELELAQKCASLAEVSKVEAMSFAAGRQLRDALLGIVPALSAEIAAMSDPWEVETKLREAIRKVLTDAARMQADDIAHLVDATH